jgi:ankyrin repeat protein
MFRATSIAVVFAAAGFAANIGPSALADAAMREDKAAVQALIQEHADVNASQVDGTTALHWAAHNDDAEAIELLLKAGAKARVTNRYGITPLSEACLNGDAAIIEKLIKAGADPNAPHAEGETPLMTAARTGNPDAVKVLLDHGARVNTTESWRGQSALMWASAENHPEAAKLLIARGADIDAHSGVFDYSGMKAKAGSIGMNWPRGGFTPLLFAAREGAVDTVRVLLDAGANINLPDPDGSTPLLLAIINFHYDIAGVLLDRGADVNAADSKGRTPLYAAVDMQDLDVSTRPPTKVADKRTSLDIIKSLLEHGASPNAELIKVIPPRGVLDGADGTMGVGSTPFLRAARASDVEVMKLLLAKGANPKMTTQDDVSALMLAAGISWRDGKTRGAEKDSVEAIRLCLDLGLDINAASARGGETAMHGAAGRGADLIVQFLADHGANVDAKDKQGRTPIDTANGVGAGVGGVRSPHDSTVALLAKLGGHAGQPATETAKN